MPALLTQMLNSHVRVFCFRFILIISASALLSLQSLGSECPQQDLEARRLLEKMTRGYREQNYSGIFTYEYGAEIQSLSIDHNVYNGIENEQLTHLDGELRTVTRKDHPLNCLHPGHRLVQFNYHLNDDVGCGLSDYYRFSIESQQRIAGRESVQLRVIPRDMYRYGYQFSLDKTSGLLLKSQVIGQKGQVLERFKFSTLRITNTADRTIKTIDSGHMASHPQIDYQKEMKSHGIWLMGWVPPGFIRTSLPETKNVPIYTYTDGLAVFSVIVEPLEDGLSTGSEEGLAQQGAIIAHTRAIRIDKDVYLITVIGGVPLDAAKLVAAKVKLRG